jgi:hypothetical protein
MQIQWSCENSRHPQKIRTSKRRWFVAAAIAPPETSFSSQSFSLSLSLSLSRLSFAVLSSFHFPQVQFEQKNRIIRKRETLSKTEIWSRSGPQLWGSGFKREPKAGTSTFPAHNICPLLPPLRLSIPASELVSAGIKEPECLLVHPTAVTETFICPVTTQSRGSLLVCTSQMADLEPPVLP